MPTENPFVKFHSGQNQFKVPFVIYADFEAILQNVDEEAETNPDPLSSYTRKINRHVPSGFCTYGTFTYGKVKDPLFQYRGEDCVEVFCNHLEEEAKRLYHMFPPNKLMDPLTPRQKREFRIVRNCHICMYPFHPGELEVRDHCHYTGKYRGAAHEMCNIRYAIPNFIPIVLHNLSGYNVHLFIRELGKKFDSESIDVIAENKEKYISFGVKVVVDELEIPGSKEKIATGNETITRGNEMIATCKTEGKEEMIAEGKKILAEGKKLVDEGESKKKIYRKLRFIDSVRFMPSSLDSLSRNLVGTNSMLCGSCFSEAEFTHIDHNYYAHGKCGKCQGTSRRKLEIDLIFDNLRFGLTDEQFRLLLRKGVYPYEYMDDWAKFKEKQLPPTEAFYSELNLSGISKCDYNHAQRVWREFDMKSLGEYHDLYLKTDVLLLANVFETFRKACLEHYALDPAHFYTSPGLAWQACLKMTGIRLKLLTDPNMLLMFEQGTRGGIKQAVHRYARANNKYMGEKFDPSHPSRFLLYSDKNNLYGHAMSQKLPTGGFKWVENLSEFTRERIHELMNGEKGYLLEVNIPYPPELHESHNDLPFLLERMELSGIKKLVPNLYNKGEYVVHIAALDQALQHRLILEKVHQVIEFNQSGWLKSYIDFNTQPRKNVRNDFEKDFFKLMNNAVFRKTMENIRKHRNINLVTNKEAFLKKVMQPNFKSRIVFSENLVGCEMGKKCIVMNKPVYIGQAILDLSKIIMYEFH